jgi:hypothetical protein
MTKENIKVIIRFKGNEIVDKESFDFLDDKKVKIKG